MSLLTIDSGASSVEGALRPLGPEREARRGLAGAEPGDGGRAA